jgi:hypothetical protein
MATSNTTMEAIAFDNEDYLPEFHEAHGAPVYEDDGVVIFADGTGQELNAIAEEYADVTRSELSEWAHEFARDVCDYSWSASDPVVVFKSV